MGFRRRVALATLLHLLVGLIPNLNLGMCRMSCAVDAASCCCRLGTMLGIPAPKDGYLTEPTVSAKTPRDCPALRASISEHERGECVRSWCEMLRPPLVAGSAVARLQALVPIELDYRLLPRPPPASFHA